MPNLATYLGQVWWNKNGAVQCYFKCVLQVAYKNDYLMVGKIKAGELHPPSTRKTLITNQTLSPKKRTLNKNRAMKSHLLNSVATNSGLLNQQPESASKPPWSCNYYYQKQDLATRLFHTHTWKVYRSDYAERSRNWVLLHLFSRIKLPAACWYLPRISLLLNKSQELYIT